jgi:ABC-type branched-subunit amino acid transport system substrate-binding protein
VEGMGVGAPAATSVPGQFGETEDARTPNRKLREVHVRNLIFALLLASLAVLPARAQVKVGIIVSATGPGASVGMTQQRTAGILARTLGGQPVRYILLDDGSDTSATVADARRLGAGFRSTFAAYLWDAQLILNQAIASASAKAEPGTEAFRSALRDAIENAHNVAASNGVHSMSPVDHVGLDERSLVMTQIVGGAWKLVP